MTKLTVIIIAVAVALVSFWGGTYYRGRQFMSNRPFGTMGAFGQMPRGTRFGGQTQWFGNRGAGDGPRGARTISGRLDRVTGDKLTLTTTFGSIKVTLDEGAKIKRTEKAALSDLEVGKQLIIQGAVGADGQVTAKSVIEE